MSTSHDRPLSNHGQTSLTAPITLMLASYNAASHDYDEIDSAPEEDPASSPSTSLTWVPTDSALRPVDCPTAILDYIKNMITQAPPRWGDGAILVLRRRLRTDAPETPSRAILLPGIGVPTWSSFLTIVDLVTIRSCWSSSRWKFANCIPSKVPRDDVPVIKARSTRSE